MKRKLFGLALAGALSLVAVAPASADDPAYSGTAVTSLTATLLGTAGTPIGTVQLHQDAAGVVLVRIDAAGIPAGAHGVHIHQTGKCEGPAFTTAGGHFNPGNKKHGLSSAEGPHAGDLAQIPAAFDGSGTHQATTDRISLTSGPTSIQDADGSALIVHAAADDQATDPTGNSGGRIACAVLAAPQPSPSAPLPPNTGTGSSTRDGSTTAAAGIAVIALACALGAAQLVRGVASRRRA